MALALQRRRVMAPQPQIARRTGSLPLRPSFVRDGAQWRFGLTASHAFLVNGTQR